MRTRRILVLSTAVAATVVLGACSSDDPEDGRSSVADSPAVTTSVAARELPAGAVGDALDNGDVTLTVHMITAGEQCDYGSDGTLPNGSVLVQIRAEVDNRGDSGTILAPVDVVNEDGSSVERPEEMKTEGPGCVRADHSDDYDNWDEELPPGGPTYVYGSIAVPAGAKYLGIGDHRFEIPDTEVDDVQGPNPTPGEDAAVLPEETPGYGTAGDSGAAAPGAADPGAAEPQIQGDYICPDSGARVTDPMDCQRPDGWDGPYYVDVDPGSSAYDPRFYHEDGTAKTSTEIQNGL